MKVRLLYVACVLLIGLDVAMLWKREALELFIINARAGCFPWSPTVVEYHEGMTVCPGQSFKVRIPIWMEPHKPDKGI